MKTIMEMNGFLAKKVRGYDIGDLAPIVIAFGLIAIIGAVVLLILGNFQTQAGNTCINTVGNAISQTTGLCINTANTAAAPSATSLTPAYNGLGYGTSGINQIMTFLPLMALVIVAAVIIGTVVGAFVLGGGAKKEF